MKMLSNKGNCTYPLKQLHNLQCAPQTPLSTKKAHVHESDLSLAIFNQGNSIRTLFLYKMQENRRWELSKWVNASNHGVATRKDTDHVVEEKVPWCSTSCEAFFWHYKYSNSMTTPMNMPSIRYMPLMKLMIIKPKNFCISFQTKQKPHYFYFIFYLFFYHCTKYIGIFEHSVILHYNIMSFTLLLSFCST